MKKRRAQAREVLIPAHPDPVTSWLRCVVPEPYEEKI
jgi:hypothetical protein